MKKIIKVFTLLSTCVAMSCAQAGLVTQHTSAQTFQRTCPGLADPDWQNNWGPIVNWFYGGQEGSDNADLMCHFNGGNQERFFNADGSPKDPNWRYDENWPKDSGGNPIEGGGAFSIDEVGTLEIIGSAGPETERVIGAVDGKYYAQIILDEDNLGLPEIKAMSDSELFERNSVNAFAATEYLWTGASETLEFTADYDFFTSGGTWQYGNAPAIDDYTFILGMGVSNDMEFDVAQVFPTDWGNIIEENYIDTRDGAEPAGSLNNPNEGSFTISFDVNDGDRFFLWGYLQAFGLNGGFTDASHTLTSALAVENKTPEQSAAIFQTSLSAAPPTSVPEPSSLILAFLGLLGLAARKKY
ncbi:PEP-CTERM sorting domain-containing protein [Thalassotalea sp. M1531]|uniref:PEP-CTERM sorting domain-containing protein n=1 Tax=Thalassotalea algicola TaxID=2716224 RepID=A0A7Y0LFF2_9GAMM|nr:PEP-CTERM sorting domain-containing protein [Thalassotalea algicola]NMP32200.1 PEP-CTERM sorting domain-containing protein [Thalassotalea algicola]